MPLRLKDVFSNIYQGIVSMADDIFILKGKIEGSKFKGFSSRLNKEIILEKEILIPILKGDDIKRYKTLNPDLYIIFPHFLLENKTKPYEEEYFKSNFPQIYEYLSLFKNKLVEKKIKWETNAKYWYSSHRGREISDFQQPKIISAQITIGSNMVFDSKNLYFNSGTYGLIKKSETKEDYKYFLCLLNSNILWFFIKNTGDILRGGYFRYKTEYLEPFPIPKLESLDQQKPFIEKAEQLIELTNDFYSNKESFLDWLVVNFKLEKQRNKFENIHKMTKDQFFEKLKELKVDLSDFILFENLTKNLMILFNNYNNLVNLEQETNEMVYKLYNLTKEDIKIIEDDIKRTNN